MAKRICFFLALITPCLVFSQTAELSGLVKDPAGAVVPNASIEMRNQDTGIRQRAETNSNGLYALPGLKPGSYLATVQATGFKTLTRDGIVLEVAQRARLDLTLELGSVEERVTVNADVALLNSADGSVSTVVESQFIENIPLNGRSFQTLFQLTPGTVTTQTTFGEQGQFSVNGQRANANYFMVDGVSANTGIAAGSTPGQSFGGALPALTAAGGTNSMVSVGAVQEFAIQTSTYAPEFGRTPGGQVSITTRSGGNDFHGELFDYFRNNIFDANNWFANRQGIARPALRQNDFGGVLGGPIRKNNTFFFFSYEGLRLRLPVTSLTEVPGLALRNTAPASLQPFLKAFPLPTGPDQGNGLAPANYGYSNPSQLDSTSLRIDHRLSPSLLLFGRYSYAPSDTAVRGGGSKSLNTVIDTPFKAQTLTFGLTFLRSSVTNDFRFNWSKAESGSFYHPDDFGGAVPLSSQSLYPAGVNPNSAVFGLGFFNSSTATLNYGTNADNEQRQINVLDNVSWQKRNHLFKFGFDYRRLTPRLSQPTYTQVSFFDDVPSALRQTSSFTAVATYAGPVSATFSNYSLYGQDTWKLGRLSITYGLRWEYNPAPSGTGRNGLSPFAVVGFSNVSTLALAPAGTSLYRAPAANFAPRLGIAYQLGRKAETQSVIRAGFGVFYDLGTGPAGDAFSYFPYLATRSISTPHIVPLSASDAAPVSLTLSPPYAKIIAFPQTLRLPYTLQWNIAYSQALGINQTLTVTYVGADGHRLLRRDNYVGAALPSTFTQVDYVNNTGYSNYNALQAEFRRRSSRHLTMLASYTWAHSLDVVSSDSAFVVPGTFINPRADYGASDFDIRHTGSVGLDYALPVVWPSRWATLLFGGWSLDAMTTARTAPPVNVIVSRNLGFGSYSFRPDLVTGAPMYTDDPNAPDGRRFNTGALSTSIDARQGTLARNVFRGFPVFQQDLGVQRNIHLTERVSLQARIEAFNIFNHPNFAPPIGNLGTVTSSGSLSRNAQFGLSQSMLGQGLQLGGFGSGFSPLYQIGGPRSLQMSLRLRF
jgi:hypothetical protein